MPWIQTYTPVAGSLGMSALVAAIPLVVIFVCLAVLKMKAHKAGPLAVASAIAIAIAIWGMPAKLAGLAFVQGAAFGLFPVFYIVITTLFLYNITVKGGQFEVIRASLAGVTGDRRIQALLIAFCFGAFIEGAAGFGTPVAIAGATLAGLGFRPLYAAGVCLVANTAPVAFGAIGIPVVALAGVMGYGDDGMMKLSTMVGRQLPFISVFIPFYVILIMVGFKKTMEVLPAVIVCGVTFAVVQWATASYLGPYLPDVTASLASIITLVLLLKVWQPKENYVFDHETESTGTATAHHYTAGEVFRAWSPYLALTIMVLLWGIPSIKTVLDTKTVEFEVPGLHNAIVKKVNKPEDGLKKIAKVNEEIDKQLATLSPADPKQQELAAKLKELKGLEEAFQPVETGLAGKGAVLTDERLKSCDLVSKKMAETKKLCGELVKVNAVGKDQLKPLEKAVADQLPIKIGAKYKFNFWSAAGTAILIAAFISSLLCGVSMGDTFRLLGKTLYDMRFPALTVASVLGLAYVMNTSGMTNCLGLIFTKTGHWFPLIAPFLGWLGVFLTGSDTSSNVLFGGLQKATAEQLGLSPILTGAANTSGGVMGKMISPQSLAVATAATGMVGEEGTLFRFTLKHSLFLTVIVGIIVYLQAYVLQWMIP
ncbi:L-lactate permease [Geobacter sp. SVR]|uniref:L-lactate permease n=1 Tax=Geobacter sp. SVR TaxID=2495594 RepID=UPI00143EF7AD|nr:L-lactate permease [Geobacter sp. SVR]BCS52617.1 lactate permease [Geobacter sp. SVR]GCF83945.1 lactate permease [Geobacter sp. SVR]